MHTESVVPAPVKEEPEKIKKWREEQKARLEEKGKQKRSVLSLKCDISCEFLKNRTNKVEIFRCRGGEKEGRVERSCEKGVRRMV